MRTSAAIQIDLDAAYAARLKVFESQQYTVSDGVVQRNNRRAELEQLEASIATLEQQLQDALTAEGASTRRRILYIR